MATTRHTKNRPSHAAEAAAILKLKNNDLMGALEVAQGQMNILYLRAQVLMSLAGIVVTVTGFSGRLIAGTSPAAQGFLIAGLFVCLVSAVWIFFTVARVRWITCIVADDEATALVNALIRRDSKTRAYAIGGCILFFGMILYCISIALMLSAPAPMNLPVR